MRAFIIVDIQNDFLPGGPLGVPEGDQVIPIINHLLHEHKWDIVVATQDWHPKNHCSFATTYNKKPGEIVEVSGIKQILWPEHCVQNTKGADFPHAFETSRIDKIVHKGTDPLIDSYSTFFDNQHRKSTELHDFLQRHHINEIFIAGLATDYCVRFSSLDGLQLGYKVFVIADACRGVNLKKDDSKQALEETRRAGAKIITSREIPHYVIA